MKKLAVLFMALVLAFSFAGCTQETRTSQPTQDSEQTEQTEQTPQRTPRPERTPAPEAVIKDTYEAGYWLGKSYYNDRAKLSFTVPNDNTVNDAKNANDVILDPTIKDYMKYDVKITSRDGYASMLFGGFQLKDATKSFTEKDVFSKFVEIQDKKFKTGATQMTAFDTTEDGTVELAGKTYKKFTIHTSWKNGKDTWKTDESFYIAPHGDEYMLVFSTLMDVENSKVKVSTLSGPAAINSIMRSIVPNEVK